MFRTKIGIVKMEELTNAYKQNRDEIIQADRLTEKYDRPIIKENNRSNDDRN